MKTNSTLKTIVLEETFKLKRERLFENIKQLQEYVTTSRVTPGFKIAKPWEGKYKKAENVLKQLGAKPFSNGLNPHGYELDTDKDRLWFYDNGEVYSTASVRTLGYLVNPDGSLKIMNDAKITSKSWPVGTIKRSGSKAVFIPSKENAAAGKTEKEKEEKPSSWVDTLQTVLDWLGFIPGYGDIIDAINAAIYFYRGKYFDGFLSAIAIIPIIGSAIKVSAKAVYKGAKLDRITRLIQKAFKGGGQAAQLKMWDDLIQTGVIKPSQLAKIGSGLESLESVIKSSYSTLKKAPVPESAKQQLFKQLDDFSGWLRQNNKAIEQISGAKKTVAPTTFKGYTIPKGLSGKALQQAEKFNRTSGKLLNKLRKTMFLPEKKLLQVAQGLERRFVREMKQDPTKLMAITKLLPGKQTRDVFSFVESQVRKHGSTADLSYIRNLDPSKASGIDDMMRYLKSSVPQAYDNVSSNIVEKAMATNSPIYNTFKANTLNNLKTVLSKDMIPAGKTIFNDVNMSVRKSLDVIWNETHDALESAGIEWGGPGTMPKENQYDAADGVAWPIVAQSVEQLMPGFYNSVVKTKDSIVNYFDVLGVGKLANAGSELLKDKSAEKYDPKLRGTYK